MEARSRLPLEQMPEIKHDVEVQGVASAPADLDVPAAVADGPHRAGDVEQQAVLLSSDEHHHGLFGADPGEVLGLNGLVVDRDVVHPVRCRPIGDIGAANDDGGNATQSRHCESRLVHS